MIFENRQNAGKLLAESLKQFKGAQSTLVVGLPRGGVVVAHKIATLLGLPLDIVCPRKIGAPHNPELAIGAVTETGEGVFDERLIAYLKVTPLYIQQKVSEEAKVAQRRLQLFRKGMLPRDFKEKTVIIVDDGLATGSTMKAAIKSIKSEGAKEIVIAVPVAPAETLQEMALLANRVYCISTPPFFEAVGQFYREFDQTSDEEVVELMGSLKDIHDTKDIND